MKHILMRFLYQKTTIQVYHSVQNVYKYLLLKYSLSLVL